MTLDKQYGYMFDEDYVPSTLGVVAYARWRKDPKTLLFQLSRYKFVAQMLKGMNDCAEVGCGDGWSSNIVGREVKNLLLTDYDKEFVEEARKICKLDKRDNARCEVHNMLDGPFSTKKDGIYALDVLEHIEPQDEDKFIGSIVKSLRKGGVCIFGMPTLISQELIAKEKRDPGHINCKTEKQLRSTMSKHFETIFTFNMNDECIFTGNGDLAYYVFAVGINVN